MYILYACCITKCAEENKPALKENGEAWPMLLLCYISCEGEWLYDEAASASCHLFYVPLDSESA